MTGIPRSSIFPLFLSVPRGLEYLLEAEARALGLAVSRVSPQGVYGEADLDTLYRLCLWSRLANRVQLLLCEGKVTDEDSLYRLVKSFAWESIFDAHKTILVEFHGTNASLRNTLFSARKVKDAVADRFREQQGTRPSVSREKPDIRLQAWLHKDVLSVSLDMTGYSLHQRGYRLEAGQAPLKENVAAAMLVRAGWPQFITEDAAFCDPFCGSGTLVIEAALMGADKAPGLLRNDQAFVHWKGHCPARWEALCEEARARIKPPRGILCGYDTDASAIAMARANAKRAGVEEWVQFERAEMETVAAPTGKGLLVTNPPFGVRLEDRNALIPLFRALGRQLHAAFQGWRAAILCPDPLLARAIGLRSDKQYSISHGPLACTLWCFPLDESNRLRETGESGLGEEAGMLANRLLKNRTHLNKWLRRTGVACYRLYDADLPQYAFAVDCYADWVVVQEYAPPADVPPHKAERRRLDMLEVLTRVLEVPSGKLVMKERRVQKGTNQYRKLDATGERLVVTEGQARFYVNLQDYLDTGLFPDHRLLRLQFGTLPPGTRFLNLFCYTASASVHAALAGARTVNVDMSRTWLRWAEDNFRLNALDTRKHTFIREDCRNWLRDARGAFDVIFLDPPSFSNSKRMEGTLDIQRDHQTLITDAMRLLAPQGTLYFSTNLRQFRLDEAIRETFAVEDITASTIDEDFRRNPKVHVCFRISG